MKTNRIFLLIALALTALVSGAQNNIVEEVAWIIGDTPIWKSDIEEQYNNMKAERTVVNDPYCLIPEMMAIEKLYLHQADIDTLLANDAMVMSEADGRISRYMERVGGKEKLEEYFNKPYAEIRQSVTDMIRNDFRVRMVQQKLTENIKVTPSDVRKYFEQLPADSLPFIPLQVEVQIITVNPVIPRQEIEDVKARLRSYSEQVTNGEKDFGTLAVMYSEDRESAFQRGELGFMGRAELDPEFAAVAFNLNDPKKVSKIVESEYGYHIIQLIEKLGDRINVRHILLTPKASENEINDVVSRMDSLHTHIMAGELTFDEAVPYVSQDKDTKKNHGVMVNVNNGNSTRFTMKELPTGVSSVVDTMKVGEVSAPFVMMDEKKNREVVAMVKLKSRIEGHKANLIDDYNVIKMMYENSLREKILKDWLEKKISETYVRVEPGWRNCDFQHKGWIRTSDTK